MQDKASNSSPNNSPRISEALLNFINAMVEEIVLEGKPFDEQKKKWLKKYSEAEGVNYEKLVIDLTDFFEVFNEYSTIKSEQIKRMIKQQGSQCYITDETFEKLQNKSFTQTKPHSLSTFTETVNGVSFDMVAIKSGTFTMGSPEGEVDRGNDETRHSVTLSSYNMGATEVTQELWKAVMGSNPSYFKGDNLPVEQVSWDDCQEFIRKLNQLTGKTYRLPTEAEWEYACRAGATTTFNTGSNLTTDQANYDGNYPYNGNAKGQYREKTTPVGSFPRNALGLYDMHGNVWEWCSDWYDDYPTGAQTNPQGASSGSGRVLRGGSWASIARDCRSANRNNNTPDFRFNFLGFRLVSP